MKRRFLLLLFQHSRIPLSASLIDHSLLPIGMPRKSAYLSMKRMRSDSYQLSHETACQSVASWLATMPSVNSSLRDQTTKALRAFLSEWETEPGLSKDAQSSTLTMEEGLVGSAQVIRRVAAEDKKLTTRKKLQSAASYIQDSSTGMKGSDVGSFLSISLVLAVLAVTTTSDNRNASRSAASAFASTLQDSLKNNNGILLNHEVFEELVYSLVQFAVLTESSPIPHTDEPVRRVDLHILTTLARSLDIKTCSTQAIAEDAAKVIRRALMLDDVVDANDRRVTRSEVISIDQVFDAERSINVASGLSLAAQIGPWQTLDAVELVRVAVLYNQWHAAERVCHSVTSSTDDRWSRAGVIAVHALIDSALSSRLYRQADTFATQFFDVGGQSRFLEARFLHACDTISKVIQKRALPVIERQVERIDQSVKKMSEYLDSSDTLLDGTTSVANASADIREFAIRQLEESLDIDTAYRLASIWNMSYTYNETDVQAALAARREKFLQWEDLLPGKAIPELLSTPESLEAAFLDLGVHAVYGFDVEWGDDGSGAALLQIASTECAILVDVPALSTSVEGADALERTVGKLFASSDVAVVGFGCRQDLVKLRSSPCARQRHWFTESTSVRDLQSLMDGTTAQVAMGLSRCCEQFLTKPLDKSEQCSDWLRRPLTTPQRVYASLDALVCAIIFAQSHPKSE